MGIGEFVPWKLKHQLKKVRDSILAIAYRGTGRYCPVCNKPSRKFAKAGTKKDAPRKDARCGHCGALERHRLVWLYLREKTDLFSGKPIKMLHVAPEPVFERLMKHSLGSGYLTSDLYDPHAMVKMDVTYIQYPDGSFDVIYCSHVLQYVSDDKQAIREFFRVLKPDGWAILLVPITADRTFEDSFLHNPYEHSGTSRTRDHVRRYGADYVERLKEGGFKVRVIYPSDIMSEEDIMRMAITSAAGAIYYCTKK